MQSLHGQRCFAPAGKSRASLSHSSAASRRPAFSVASPGGNKRTLAPTSSLICQALVLVPAGAGTTDHLDEPVGTPKEIELEEGQFEIGRDEDAQIVIPYPTVSSRHAMLRITGDSVSVTDLNSTNGTYISDNELVPMEAENLSIGQNVTFGDMYLAQYKLEKRGD